MVRAWDKQARLGDWVTVQDKSGQYVGQGFFNPRSQIAVRLLRRGPEIPDPGGWIAERIRDAVSLRRRVLGLDAATDAYRLVNAEGDGLSGLVADRYGEAIVLELFSIWPLARLADIEAALREAFPDARIVLRADPRVQTIEGFAIPPARAARGVVTVREHGVRLRVDLAGHKTGAFLDQRDNRRRVAALAAGRRVLDGCAYTGGFAIAAALQKADAVTAVDLDADAVALARANAAANRVRIGCVHADLFPYLRDAKRHGKRYDLVILDPPKFVTAREDLRKGLDKYFDLNRAALDVIAPGGILVTCSCSGLVSDEAFLEMLAAVSTATRRDLQVFAFAHAAPDHPFRTDCPESRYLKAAFARAP